MHLIGMCFSSYFVRSKRKKTNEEKTSAAFDKYDDVYKCGHPFWHQVCHVFGHLSVHIFWSIFWNIFWNWPWHGLWRMVWDIVLQVLWHIVGHTHIIPYQYMFWGAMFLTNTLTFTLSWRYLKMYPNADTNSEHAIRQTSCDVYSDMCSVRCSAKLHITSNSYSDFVLANVVSDSDWHLFWQLSWRVLRHVFWHLFQYTTDSKCRGMGGAQRSATLSRDGGGEKERNRI